MTIETRVAELTRSNRRHPFIHDFDRDTWTRSWCERCQFGRRQRGCTLLSIAVRDQRTPAAWRTDQDTGVSTRYTCAEWRPA